MPGHNHYSWCICGWCYKTGSNGYSTRRLVVDFDKSYAKRTLKEHGADQSWTACFVVPNASCPVCSAKVYYYQNKHGSRVLFDELGWPWPKHYCTNKSKTSALSRISVPEPFIDRKRGAIAELIGAAQTAEFDLNATFRGKYGQPPFDLLKVLDTARCGFKNFIKAYSISPSLDEPLFIKFTSAKTIPNLGDYFSFSGRDAYFLNAETLSTEKYKSVAITPEEFAEVAGREQS